MAHMLEVKTRNAGKFLGTYGHVKEVVLTQ
jgi:hypothetical protein